MPNLRAARSAFHRSQLQKGYWPQIRHSVVTRAEHLKPIPNLQGFRCFSEDVSEDVGRGFRTIPGNASAFRDSYDFRPHPQKFSSLKDNLVGQQVELYGWLGRQSKVSRKLTFAQLLDPDLKFSLQLVATGDAAPNSEAQSQASPKTAKDVLASLNHSTPVLVCGILQKRKPSGKEAFDGTQRIDIVELDLQEIHPLNTFPEDLVKFTKDEAPPPERRYLQLRLDSNLRRALAVRDSTMAVCRSVLRSEHNFLEVETPLLFKSTPEGAREFLVPTRTPGLAYALPQSPQQYKQMLISGGISRYFQFARCFRDEDLRADRQPEFTQLDLEMAFATGHEVKRVVEQIICATWDAILEQKLETPFGKMTYEEAMSNYGSDKPDRRLGMELHRIDYLLPADLISKITPLTSPVVDMLVLPAFETPRQTQKFISAFMESKEAADAGVLTNSDGQPGIFVFNSQRPLSGLQSLGFEAAEVLESKFNLKDGDLIVIQARRATPFSGGATALGRIRLALHREAVAKGILPPAQGFDFLWVEDFPLFKPNDEDPGQGGSSGFSSTHHPFTAPKTVEDIDKLAADPTTAVGDHYDLVVNGVELGGGSRRIHNAAFQEYVLRDVLKMSEAGIEGFRHLLEALRAGCPPHAGFALGFDRLIAVLTESSSIREVIAFPKNGRGEDLLVKSPQHMTAQQLDTYHLALKK